MKIIYLYASIIFIILAISCNRSDKLDENIVFGTCLKASTNYFESDSIQNLMGYYPPKIYFYLEFPNATKKDIYIPISDGINDSIHTVVIGKYLDSILKLYQISDPLKNLISPGDSLQLILSLDLQQNLEIDIVDTIKLNDFIFDIANKIELFYSVDELDMPLSNSHLPDSVILLKSNSYAISFRDSDDKGDHMWF